MYRSNCLRQTCHRALTKRLVDGCELATFGFFFDLFLFWGNLFYMMLVSFW